MGLTEEAELEAALHKEISLVIATTPGDVVSVIFALELLADQARDGGQPGIHGAALRFREALIDALPTRVHS